MGENTKQPKKGLGRLLEIAGTKKTLLTISCIVSVISTLLMFTPFISIYFIIEEVIKNASNISAIDIELIRNCGIYALIGLILSLITLYISTMCSHVAAFRILYNLRMKLVNHLAKLPMGYHTKKSSGSIKKTLELSVEKIEGFIAHQLPDLVGAIVSPLVILVSMYILDWRLALAATVPIVFSFTLQAIAFSGKKGADGMKNYHDKLEQMNASGVEFIRGMPMVKVFGMKVENFFKFRDSIMEYKEWGAKYSDFCKKPYNVFLVILSSIAAFIVPVGIFILSKDPSNQALALTVMIFVVLVPGISIPILKLMYLGGNMRLIAEGTARMDKIFSQEPLVEPLNPKIPSSYDVSFENVSFSYIQENNEKVHALKDVSIKANSDEITALVGPSGSGKSTIANLIPRFWEVDKGAIKIGGIDIRDIGTEKLMNIIAFVFQDVHLFYDTIEENIKMGQEASFEEVKKAAKIACCDTFIQKLPEGYKTKIGEGGTYLSGGEAQRIGIARAIIKNAPILILDEATAYADAENEQEIQNGLSALIKNKTVIVIAHRLSTIKEADQILVIENGKVVGADKHNNLFDNNELYRRMWEAHIQADGWEFGKNEKVLIDREVIA